MSDTPRTDAAEIEGYPFNYVEAGFSRYIERELVGARAEVVKLKGEAESWEKVFDKTCQLLAEEKTALAEVKAKERERCALVCERKIVAPAGTYQILMAAAAAIRKGE